jgi:hypothetical protein
LDSIENSSIDHSLKKNVNTVLIICFYFQTAAGSLEVLFVEDQVNSENITLMADIQNNFQINLEAKLFKLAETMDLSRAQVDDMLEKLTTTTTTTVNFINPSALNL